VNARWRTAQQKAACPIARTRTGHGRGGIPRGISPRMARAARPGRTTGTTIPEDRGHSAHGASERPGRRHAAMRSTRPLVAATTLAAATVTNLAPLPAPASAA
jgi:hypothetical protein